ncbi:MAG: CPBP family intramembrane glutamic endopeptidase [Pseudomonadota bacterium]|nr:CPBP family intramembrane glutamic endopeptidase [Pseudomonadota bacterium]
MADPKPQLPHPEKFINMAFWFEASLIGVAWLIGWFAEINPIANLYFSTEALIDGITATIPMLILFLLFYQYPVGPLYPIKKSLLDIMGPLLSSCRWYELLILAAVAGISEEVLFRGVLQPWMEVSLGVSAGLIVSNVIFGLLHWITATYALIAGLIGLYLAYMMDVSEPRNLLTPIVVHGLYDFLAFVFVAAAYRLQQENR